MPRKHRIGIWIFVFLLMLSMPVTVFANSAEPPGIIVIVLNAPEDISLTLEYAALPEEEVRISHSSVAWETHFSFYYPINMVDSRDAVIRVTSQDGSFTCPLPDGITNHYRNLLTLDYATQSLTSGQPAWRQPLYVALRVFLTLILEGIVFFLFGFRQKRSWIVFLALNLVTQLWVNLFISGSAFSGGYWIFGYWGIELVIFLVESVVFPLATREKKKWQCVLYALTANLVSLLAGGWLISHLPV